MRPVHGTVVLALPVLMSFAGTRQARAQTANIRVSGRAQSQYSTVSGDASNTFNPSGTVSSGFEVRRLRIQADVRIGENVSLVIQPSFEMASLRMRDAYLRVGFVRSPSFNLGFTMGQEKRPFNRYELTSSNTLPSIERGARFRGFTGALAAQNNLLEDNGYVAHDLGASLDFTGWDGRLSLKAGMYNGSGESAADVNNSRSFGGRAVATVLQDAERRPALRLGAALISRDRAVTSSPTATTFAPDSTRRTSAFGMDAEWGDFRPGLHVIADFATGEALADGNHCLNGATPIPCRFGVNRNTGNLRPNAPDSAIVTFRSLHAVVSWRWQPGDPEGTRLIKLVEPALRIDLTDPNTGVDSDAGMLITPAVSIHFSQTTAMRVGLDYYRYRDASGSSRSVRALRLSWQSNF